MRAAFFDVDGTLTKHRVWSGLLEYFSVNRERLVRHYLFLFFHYSLYGLHRLGLVSQVKFRSIWAKNLSWHFSGYTTQQVSKIWDWVVENRLSDQWRSDIVALLQEHKSSGDLVFLVSGGPEGLLVRITIEIGGDFAVGTRHEIVDGIYSGRAEGIACQGENKALLVKERIRELGLTIDLDASYAYADSLADYQLLTMVGNPVAVYPDDGLRQIVQENGWRILESEELRE